jgi:hypothetical protein
MILDLLKGGTSQLGSVMIALLPLCLIKLAIQDFQQQSQDIEWEHLLCLSQHCGNAYYQVFFQHNLLANQQELFGCCYGNSAAV